MSKPSRIGAIHDAIDCLGRLSEIFRQRRQELAAIVGLTDQQWSVLDEIENEHFMPSMFARRRESSPAAVSKILRQLQDKELVVVSVDASDGRQRKYELSARGKRTLAELRAQRQHAIEHVWQQFEAARLESFTRFGNELIQALERYRLGATGYGLGASAGLASQREDRDQSDETWPPESARSPKSEARSPTKDFR